MVLQKTVLGLNNNSDLSVVAAQQLASGCTSRSMSVISHTERRRLNAVVFHYDDVIMSAMASQITSLMIVYSTVYSDADQRKHQSSASLAFVRGIHRWPVNSPHKWPVTRKMLSFHDVIVSRTSSHILTMDNPRFAREDEYKLIYAMLESLQYCMEYCASGPCCNSNRLYMNSWRATRFCRTQNGVARLRRRITAFI